MDKYEVIGSLGEGSFGRVYKAKRVSDGSFVALKVISKRGRSLKELKGFRRECEIQRDLNHPNIIQMLDSFETENEIVVITEFAHRELNKILEEEGYLQENKVQTIVWDLVSALHYLHSNRVLHRDLKPQNILLDAKNRAKLCDFGFARNMSTGTHVLTSIKGTPLYMAPELIEEQPYDYNADLWSLGCIVYQLLVGTPPFYTNSILHLIKRIRHEQIQWPTFISENCISFLKGLLQKNPAKRMTWPEIVQHPFVKDHVMITTKSSDPLAFASTSRKALTEKANKTEQSKMQCRDMKEELKASSEKENKLKLGLSGNLNFIEENHPIETEEWIVFLQRSIKEVMSGEMISLTQSNLTNIILSPLRNTNANSKVLSFVARLLSIPFVIRGTSEDTIFQIKKVYVDVKLIPNLVYASKLVLRNGREDTPIESPSPNNSPLPSTLENYRSMASLTEDDLNSLEYMYLLINHLVHLDDDFLVQFCDAVMVLHIHVLLKLLLLLTKKRVRIGLDLLAILTHVLRKFPDNSELVEKIFTTDSNNPEIKQINIVDLLRHENPVLRERACYFLLFMGKYSQETTFALLWNTSARETLEALVFDSIESVRNAAEITVEELKTKPFYCNYTE